jgi:triosephosphate isomerase
MPPKSTVKPKPLVAGNWKMNGARASLNEITVMGQAYDADLRRNVDLLICPPSPLLYPASTTALGTGIAIGGQDSSEKISGAHTGDVSPSMVLDAGGSMVILGHSERRTDHNEKDSLIEHKACAAIATGLVAIICVGETRAEREAGRALAVVRRQLRGSIPRSANAENLVIAYEPVWAIGTGLTPTAADVAEVHLAIRTDLKKLLGKQQGEMVRILYGGSVKPGNAKELLSVDNVNGALVGGASLKAADFMAIAETYR